MLCNLVAIDCKATLISVPSCKRPSPLLPSFDEDGSVQFGYCVPHHSIPVYGSNIYLSHQVLLEPVLIVVSLQGCVELGLASGCIII